MKLFVRFSFQVPSRVAFCAIAGRALIPASAISVHALYMLMPDLLFVRAYLANSSNATPFGGNSIENSADPAASERTSGFGNSAAARSCAISPALGYFGLPISCHLGIAVPTCPFTWVTATCARPSSPLSLKRKLLPCPRCLFEPPVAPMGFPLATSPPSLAGTRFQSITAAEPSLRRVARIGPGAVGSSELPSLCSNANACSDGRAIPHWSSMPNVPLKIPLGTPPSSKTLLNVQYDIASASPMQFLMVSVMNAGFCELHSVIQMGSLGIFDDSTWRFTCSRPRGITCSNV